MKHLERITSSLAASTLTAALAAACISIPSAEEAGVSYPTTQVAWPDDVQCLGSDSPTLAKEVLMGSTRTVVVAGGPDPISDEAWASYSPSFGNQKNTDRHLLFARSCFWRSPAAPVSCEGDGCRSVVELDGHTWIELSAIRAADCVPAGASCAPDAVQPGQLAVVVTEKCHEMVFEERVFALRGPNGERAVMHATADGSPRTDVSLPEGWSLEEEPLSEPLVLHPFGDGEHCYYNVFRDSEAQAYHQIGYAGARYP